MKNTQKILISTLAYLLISTIALAQAPQTFSYQTVVRDNIWQVLQNQSIGVQVAIIEDLATGTVVYEEEHTATTNDIGLINLAIGGGSVSQGAFANIDWGQHDYFMKISVDIAGGTTYIAMGTTQLRSVPYALFAETANNAGPQGIQGIAGTNGTNGATGLTGAAGNNGIDGTNGVDGINGTNGVDGNDGAVGATGLTGADGNDGAVGATGLTGATGSQGIAGNNGIDGNDGAVGATGLTGATGSQGNAGNNGLDGIDGATGLTGAQGIQGATGNDGADGIGIAQTLSLNGDTLSISGGNYILLSSLSYNLPINISMDSIQYDNTGIVTFNAEVLPSAGSSITDKGFCWSTTNPNPTIYDNFESVSTGIGSYSYTYLPDTDSATYYVRAYATNADGMSYSEVFTFDTELVIGLNYAGGLIFSLNGNGGGIVVNPTSYNADFWNAQTQAASLVYGGYSNWSVASCSYYDIILATGILGNFSNMWSNWSTTYDEYSWNPPGYSGCTSGASGWLTKPYKTIRAF
jgi:hypothetical protein